MVSFSLSFKIPGIFPLIFSDHGWPQVTETPESKTMGKGGLLYITRFQLQLHCKQDDPCISGAVPLPLGSGYLPSLVGQASFSQPHPRGRSRAAAQQLICPHHLSLLRPPAAPYFQLGGKWFCYLLGFSTCF